MVSFWPGSSSSSSSSDSQPPPPKPVEQPPQRPGLPTTPATTYQTKPVQDSSTLSSSWWPFSSSSPSSSSPNSTTSSKSTNNNGNSNDQRELAGLSPSVDIFLARTDAYLSSWSTSPTAIAVGFTAIGCVGAMTLGFAYGRYGRRLRNADWVTPEWLGGKWVKGVVTSVGDGDNFRLYHTPRFGGYRWIRSVPGKAKDLKDETLHIRLAAIDAPEGSHFGKPGQPFAKESLEWLRSYLQGRRVYCQLVRKDQYSRIIAHVRRPYLFVPGWLYKGPNVSKKALETGHARVYEQAGAEYGDSGKEGFLALEERARKRRVGQWALPESVLGESPAEYKKRHAQAQNSQ